MLEEALRHSKLLAEIYAWQSAENRYFVHEHALDDRAWNHQVAKRIQKVLSDNIAVAKLDLMINCLEIRFELIGRRSMCHAKSIMATLR